MSAHFYPLRVAEIVPETAEANSIRFEIPPELRETFAFNAGQHLTLKATIDGEEVRRNYSLCTAPDDQDWMVTVKRIAGGIFSNWVGDTLKAGDTVEVMPPHGSFTTEFAPAAKRHVVGIAGGSGITPVMRWRTHNRFAAPMVLRVPGGFFKCGDPWHSQTNEVQFVHNPGWKVAVPSNAEDAVGLLRGSLRGNDPVLFFEHRAMFFSQGQ